MPSISITSPYGSQPSCAVFGCKTVTYGLKWQVYMGSSHHLGLFFHAKQRLYDQTYNSVCVPYIFWGFHIQNSALWTRITSLSGSKTLPVVFFIQNSVICTRMTSLYGFQPASLVLCMQNSNFRTRDTSLYGSQTSSLVLSTHNSVLSTRTKRLYWFQTPPVVFACKTATSGSE